MTKYVLSDKAIVQRPYLNISGCTNIKQVALRALEDESIDPDATAVAVGLGEENEIYCLNLSAAIVFEALLVEKDLCWIIETLSSVFDANEQDLASDVKETIAQLLNFEILIELESE